MGDHSDVRPGACARKPLFGRPPRGGPPVRSLDADYVLQKFQPDLCMLRPNKTPEQNPRATKRTNKKDSFPPLHNPPPESRSMYVRYCNIKTSSCTRTLTVLI